MQLNDFTQEHCISSCNQSKYIIRNSTVLYTNSDDTCQNGKDRSKSIETGLRWA